MTYLEIVNEVLKRLRQSTTTAVSSDEYSTLIGVLVNEAKRDVEDAWDWSALRSTATVTTTATTASYSLTNTSVRTRLMDAYNTTKRHELCKINNNEWINRQTQFGTVSSGSPEHFDLEGIDASGQLKVRVWPTPDATETLTFAMVNPQADLTSDATAVLVPSEPIIQGAYLRAINERGEDQGRLSEIQNNIYLRSLSSYVSIDANKFCDEFTWRPI